MTAICTRISVKLQSSLSFLNNPSNPYISLHFSHSNLELYSGSENIGRSEEDARLLHFRWFDQALALTTDRSLLCYDTLSLIPPNVAGLS